MPAATIEHEIQRLIEPLVADFGAEVFDVTWGGGRLKVAVEAPGGIDTTTLSQVSRTISQELDLHDPIPSRYTLEVSSPGLERRLRCPEHFAKSIGRTVTVKLRDGKTRLSGVIVEATDAEVTLRVEGDAISDASSDTGSDVSNDIEVVSNDIEVVSNDIEADTATDLATDTDIARNHDDITISYDDIARAQTVFQWQGASA